jgi:hypothetical protein
VWLILNIWQKLAEIFPKLYQRVVAECAERGRGDGKTLKLRTKTKLSAAAPAPAADAKSDQGVEMEVDTSVNDSGTSAKPSIKEYYTPVKMTPARQAMLDLALFQLVICAALPFTFVDNPWLINFLLIAIPNYVTPERTAFFIRHITEQLSVFTTELQSFLHNRVYLTLSFDGWSSRAHDEIYTFHTTLPSRRSFFTAGHVFKAVSVTAANLVKVVENRIFAVFKATSYSAVVGDGGPNVRATKIQISKMYIWILNIYDPCHNLNLFLKDLGKLFKAVCVSLFFSSCLIIYSRSSVSYPASPTSSASLIYRRLPWVSSVIFRGFGVASNPPRTLASEQPLFKQKQFNGTSPRW